MFFPRRRATLPIRRTVRGLPHVGSTGTSDDDLGHQSAHRPHLSGGHTSGINTIRFSPHGKRVATASWDMTARIWDATTGALLARLSGQGDFVLDVAFSPDGLRVVTASRDTRARTSMRAPAGSC